MSEPNNEQKPQHDKILFPNKWFQVMQKPNGYVYYTCPWSGSKGVAILPYTTKGSGLRFLGVYETAPAHSDYPELGAIQGGYDNSDKFTIPQCVINELKEEGGFKTAPDKLISLGSVFNSKGSDNITYLFAVNLDDCKEVEAEGDGTGFEKGMWASMITVEELLASKDPLLSTMYARLIHKVPGILTWRL